MRQVDTFESSSVESFYEVDDWNRRPYVASERKRTLAFCVANNAIGLYTILLNNGWSIRYQDLLELSQSDVSVKKFLLSIHFPVPPRSVTAALQNVRPCRIVTIHRLSANDTRVEFFPRDITYQSQMNLLYFPGSLLGEYNLYEIDQSSVHTTQWFKDFLVSKRNPVTGLVLSIDVWKSFLPYCINALSTVSTIPPVRTARATLYGRP